MHWYERLTFAMQEWERRQGRVGLGGTQAALTRALAERFGARAPVGATVSKYLRRESVPGLDGSFMLAIALGVRPAWLAFAEEPINEEAPATIRRLTTGPTRHERPLDAKPPRGRRRRRAG